MRRFATSASFGKALLAAAVCVLGLQQIGSAQPKPAHEPFANSVAQQAEMIQLLKEINLQLKEQNNLLKNGVLRVTVDRGPAAGAGVGTAPAKPAGSKPAGAGLLKPR
ncbi:MAG: hypothetical protein JNK76_09500 [Planctomycetales bacterium]|nr:hypothetical protein [Planctomycetales bacterium]